jgi:hypothetical protein
MMIIFDIFNISSIIESFNIYFQLSIEKTFPRRQKELIIFNNENINPLLNHSYSFNEYFIVKCYYNISIKLTN